MRRPTPKGQPVVVKVGSSSLTQAEGGIDLGAVRRVVDHVASLMVAGYPAALVSSGAVAAGIPVLGSQPTDLPGFQVAAAVGQSRLMERYSAEFAERGLTAGQVLLTKDVLADRSQYLNAKETLARMLSLGVVPVVNENDTVAVEELRFGDNDRLAAVVSHLAGAGLLIMLTDTAGLYSGDPRVSDDVELITAIRHTDEALDDVVRGSPGPLGSGGIATKVAAARIAAWSGIPTVIADAARDGVVAAAVAGTDVGSWIDPHDTALPARKLWIAFGQPSEGSIAVDAGAAEALTQRNSSLLPVGITSVQGDFGEGAAIEITDPSGALIGKGLTRLGAQALARAAGQHSSTAGGEAIHRDDLVVLTD